MFEDLENIIFVFNVVLIVLSDVVDEVFDVINVISVKLIVEEFVVLNV